MREIKNLSLSDLKAALDFSREHLQEMKDKAEREAIGVDRIPAYKETLALENKLYHELLNRVILLK